MALRAHASFQWGSSAGMTTAAPTGFAPFDNFTSGISFVNNPTGLPSGYWLRINPAAAQWFCGWEHGITLPSGDNRIVAHFAFGFSSSLPGGDRILAGSSTALAGTTTAYIRYANTGTKLQASIDGGSTWTDGPTVAASTKYVVEFYYDISGTTYTLDWSVDGVAQTQLTRGGQTATTGNRTFLGYDSSQTADTYYRDFAVWTGTTAESFPKGKHKVQFLTVDTGGTITLSAGASSAEWNTFAGATPTLTAWDATTARNNIDEVPLNTGSAQDGLCRITGTDADFVEIPMATYTLAAGETLVGVRMLAPCWAATTTACTHSFASWNGGTATSLLAATDINTDNSAAPVWICALCAAADFDSQSELDALAFRFGSTDTTPDAGIHAIYADVLVKEATAAPAGYVPPLESQYGGYF